MTNEDLGRTFREIASHGAQKGMYSGRIADAIVSAVSDLGGVLVQDDLASHKTQKVRLLNDYKSSQANNCSPVISFLFCKHAQFYCDCHLVTLMKAKYSK